MHADIKLEDFLEATNSRTAADPHLAGLRAGTKHLVAGHGDPRSEVMFVGEAPGAVEDAVGRPFQGPSGEVLNSLLASVGLRRANVWVTNIVKYRPPGNRTPTPQEIAFSLEHFHYEWNAIEPKLTVLLGSVPTRALLGSDVKISQIQGTLQFKNRFKFLPLYHPAYILRNRTKMDEYKSGWIKLYQSIVEER